jgi:hypothetical protein
MNRFIAFYACFFVAVDAFRKASGDLPQSIFSADNKWAWNIVAAVWFIAGVRFVFFGTEDI